VLFRSGALPPGRAGRPVPAREWPTWPQAAQQPGEPRPAEWPAPGEQAGGAWR